MRREDEQHGRQQPGEPAGGSPRDDAVERAREDQQHLRDLQRARQARVVKAIAALAIVVILIIFIIANAQPVKVNFVFVTRHPRLIWVMFACSILGGVVGYIIGRPGSRVRLHRRDRQGKHEPGEGPK